LQRIKTAAGDLTPYVCLLPIKHYKYGSIFQSNKPILKFCLHLPDYIYKRKTEICLCQALRCVCSAMIEIQHIRSASSDVTVQP